MNERQKAVREANNDLEKSVEQLLADIHEEINDEERGIDENIAHSQKRFYSLVANIAKTNDKLAKRVLVLTVLTVIFALIQVIPILIIFFKWVSR